MIKECKINDLSDIVTIAYQLNNQPESNSAFCFKDYDSIKDDFTQLLTNKDNLVIGEFDDCGLVGVTGIYVDKDKLTADWVGPFICSGEYQKVANDMLKYARNRLQHIKQFNFFFHQENLECKKFMEFNNVEYITNEYNLVLNRENHRGIQLKHPDIQLENHNVQLEHQSIQPKQQVQELPDEFKNKVKDLHNIQYEDCFLSGEEIIQSDLAGRKVFCITKQDDLVGYGTYHIWKSTNRAAIDILYVKPKYTSCGYEEDLLKTMISNIYNEPSINIIGVVLEKKSSKLIDIFKSNGFMITAENCSYILKV